MRQRWRTNTAGPQLWQLDGHTAADQIPVCVGIWIETGLPFINTYLTFCVVNSDLRRIFRQITKAYVRERLWFYYSLPLYVENTNIDQRIFSHPHSASRLSYSTRKCELKMGIFGIVYNSVTFSFNC